MVKADAKKRSVELVVELPGTPEQIWQAIATGPGFTAWFVPSEIEEREGGAVVFHLGPGMDSTGHVTAWQPPHRFAIEETNWAGDAPPLGTEFIIEAQAGGTCKLRLVHSLFTSSADWDDQIDSMETGWPPFFEVLRLYLTHFAGQRAASIRPTGHYSGTDAEAWSALKDALGLADPKVGERRTSPAGTPTLSGIIERVGAASRHCELMMRLDRPAPGVALVGVYSWADHVHVAVSLYFYGDDADTVADREDRIWTTWMASRFAETD
jgi:uncharacterized protein YndB with AHSA1/START domain